MALNRQLKSGFVLYLLLWPLLLDAQMPRFFRHFDTKDGLSSNNVTCILRDKTGFLWVGTDKGLNRYDGYSFRHFLPDSRKKNRTVSNESINAMSADSDGNIWIATNNGLNRYNGASGTFDAWFNETDASLPSSYIRDVLADDNHRLWLVCDNRDLAVMDTKSGTFTTYPWKDFLAKTLPDKAKESYQPIYYLAKKSADELWLQTKFGAFSFDKKQSTFAYHPKSKEADAQPFDAASLPANCQYFGSWSSDIQAWIPEKSDWRTVPLPLPSVEKDGNRFVTKVFPVANTHWVLWRNGLMVMDETRKIHPIQAARENGFSAPTGLLSAIFQDKKGTIWLGGQQGLWPCAPQWQHFQYHPLMPETPPVVDNGLARVLHSSVDHKRYSLHVYQGLLFQQDSSGQHLLQTRKLGNGLSGILYEDKNANLWVSNGNHLFLVNRKTLDLTEIPIPKELLAEKTGHFLSMAEDNQGNLWFANVKNGLFFYQPNTEQWKKVGLEAGFEAKNPAALLFDAAKNTLWIGTEDIGLYRYDLNTKHFKRYKPSDEHPTQSLSGHSVTGLAKDRLGRIWVSTYLGGLSCFDYAAPADRAFFHIGTEQGLPSNQSLSVVADLEGNIWSGTAKGLGYIDVATLAVQFFDKRHGMEQDFLDLPLSTDAFGRLYVGSKYGYSSFFAEKLLRHNAPSKDQNTPAVLLTSFKVFEREMLDSLVFEANNALKLDWKDNFFSFSFASTDIEEPEKHRFRYRLQGYDADWRTVDVGSPRLAAYTNVPPGRYVLEIAHFTDNTWNPAAFRLELSVLPPFWKTWWFYLAVLTAIALAVRSLYRWRVSAIRREEALKSDFERQLARTEMVALRAQMNPHFVFNCLNSINRFILTDQPDLASDYLTKFSRLIRIILENSRAEIISLDRELEALRLYIEMEQMRFVERFEYHFTLSPDVQPEHLDIPSMIIQPYIENAIWHGLMHKKSKGVLSLRIFQEKKRLFIEIEDNGVGREKAAEMKSRTATPKKSLGMELTNERIALHNRLTNLDAKVEIRDLHTPDGASSGTLVVISMDIT